MTCWRSSRVILECDMNNLMHKLARSYAVTLRKYLRDEQEAVLEQAYELGRTAIAQEMGVLDVARIHQETLGKLLHSPTRSESGGRGFKTAGNPPFGANFPFLVNQP